LFGSKKRWSQRRGLAESEMRCTLFVLPLLQCFADLATAEQEAVASPSQAKTQNLRRLQEEEEEEERALPSGLEIKNGLNESIKLIVLPSWDIFLGFSDRRKIIEGRLTVISVYDMVGYEFVSEPHAIIDVENFGDGTKRHMGTISVNDPVTRRESASTSTVYIGEFAQAASPMFDMSCYPFDRKETQFRITLQKPGNMIFALSLGCANGISGNKTVNGKVIPTCDFGAKGTYVGFEWGNFTCEQNDEALITCLMDGIRQSEAIFNSYMWPSLIFTMMGFLAFALDVKMSMPRVATTMLALVSLTNLRNSVVATLPTSGSISWMEEYFLVSKTFMFLNLAGHAISFYLDAIGKKDLQKLMNKFNLWGMLLIMWLIVICRLHVRQCELVDSTLTAVLVALLSIGVFTFYVSALWLYRRAVREQFCMSSVVPAPGPPPRLVVARAKGAEDE
ncbi:Uncharacterized protein SCF082_LOCUS15274, partial [Durusdinium trenchii]